METNFFDLKNILFTLVYICTPLISLIKRDIENDILKKYRYDAARVYPVLILAYLMSRFLLVYTIFFMTSFLNYGFQEQKPIAQLSFALIDFLYWFLVKSISKRSKQIIIFKYTVAFGIEGIAMLPLSMILASFAMSFGV